MRVHGLRESILVTRTKANRPYFSSSSPCCRRQKGWHTNFMMAEKWKTKKKLKLHFLPGSFNWVHFRFDPLFCILTIAFVYRSHKFNNVDHKKPFPTTTTHRSTLHRRKTGWNSNWLGKRQDSNFLWLFYSTIAKNSSFYGFETEISSHAKNPTEISFERKNKTSSCHRSIVSYIINLALAKQMQKNKGYNFSSTSWWSNWYVTEKVVRK